MAKLHRFLKTLGPGILFASTAIGVSHLVQSTRAGALFGFGLLWAVVLVNLMKYPFFEYGTRYASAAGESIIEGYARMSKWMLILYGLLTLGTMFFVTAAVGAVTGGFLDSLFGISNQLGESGYLVTNASLFAICIGILAVGRFSILDGLIKVVGGVLLLTTIAAFVLTIDHGPSSTDVFDSFVPVIETDGPVFLFLIALMGWMPTAVDMSAWNSIWTIERIKETGYKPSLTESLREFNLGYWISAVLAILFLSLGAYLLFKSGRPMPDRSHLFAAEVIRLYTDSIGSWSYLIIASSAFSIMFGTCIAVFDGYSRAASKVLQNLFPYGSWNGPSVTLMNLILIGAGAFIIVSQFGTNLKALVDLATSLSFVVAPIIALANFRLVTGKFIPEEAKPGKAMRMLSYCGLAFLTLFSLAFLFLR